MKILLTGGTGFLGRFIVQELIKNGHTVRLLVRNKKHPALQLFDPAKTEVLEGDIMDISTLIEAVQNVDCMVHAAAMVSFQKKDRYIIKHTNETGTAQVVDVCLEHNIPKLIYIGSVSAHGRGSRNEKINEKTKWIDSPYNTGYAISKRLAELQVFRGVEEGLKAVILNPTLIIGTLAGSLIGSSVDSWGDEHSAQSPKITPKNILLNEWNSGTPKMVKQYADGYPFYPVGSNGLIAATDVAKSVIRVLDEPKAEGKRWVICAENWTYKDIFACISQAAGKPVPKIKLSPSLTSSIGILNEQVAQLFKTEPLITSETATTSGLSCHYDGSLFAQTFGFKYADMRQILTETTLSYLNSKKK